MSIYQTLKNRGFIYQCTDEETLEKRIKEGPLTLYVGYDATASSLHVGHLLPLMAQRHLQQAGHEIIILVGGATTLVGDPTGRSELRQMLTRENIDENSRSIQSDISKFVDFEGSNPARLVNNLDWLGSLNYLEFLRDYGTCFSVNRMIAQESVKLRLEKGLTFLEFNYSLLQAFDFMHLNKTFNCQLQMGGADQWGNIVTGVDLTRRVNKKEVYGLTMPLLTTSDGKKMGKTASGAIWLNEEKLKPYDYYQFWINVDDSDVERFLKIFTELPLEEIESLCASQGSELRQAKEKLAFEATELCHGKEAAEQAQVAARAAFGGQGDASQLPTLEIPISRLSETTVADVFVEANLCPSRSEFKRLVKGKGARLNDAIIEDALRPLAENDFSDSQCLIRAGKKKIYRIVLIKD